MFFVVTRSPAWIKYRPFDIIHQQIPQTFLSRPQNVWFKDGAITGFITDSHPFTTHVNSAQGLKNLKDFVQTQSKENKRFFAWIHLYEPHRSWHPHQEFEVPIEQFSSQFSYQSHQQLSKKQRQRLKNYYSEVKYIDHHLGKFMEWFYQQDLSNETLVWVIGDHGQALYDQLDGKTFVGHHVHVHSQISWIPCYVSGPELPQNKIRADLQVAQIDMMPTLFEHLGLVLPKKLYAQGTSLFELLQRSSRTPSTNPLNPRIISTEAFSVRGKALFSMLKATRGQNLDKINQLSLKIKEGGKYPPKLALQRGTQKMIYHQLLAEAQHYDLTIDPQEKTPLYLTLEEEEEWFNHMYRWFTFQNWIVDQWNLEIDHSKDKKN